VATFPRLTLPIAAATLAAALTAALPHGHASAGTTSRAHAGLRACLLVLRPKLISQGIDSLRLGLILVLVGRGALPQRRPTTTLAASRPHAGLSPDYGGNEKAEDADHYYYRANFLHNFILLFKEPVVPPGAPDSLSQPLRRLGEGWGEWKEEGGDILPPLQLYQVQPRP
jgi:hypothetical protein